MLTGTCSVMCYTTLSNDERKYVLTKSSRYPSWHELLTIVIYKNADSIQFQKMGSLHLQTTNTDKLTIIKVIFKKKIQFPNDADVMVMSKSLPRKHASCLSLSRTPQMHSHRMRQLLPQPRHAVKIETENISGISVASNFCILKLCIHVIKDGINDAKNDIERR